MTQVGHSGIWTYTTPLPSGVFTYGFFVNCTSPTQTGCTQLVDPNNQPWNKAGTGYELSGASLRSQVYVPSDPKFSTVDLSWQAPNPQHGSLTDVAYPSPTSTTPVGHNYLSVYTPPGYDRSSQRYPVLYLLHGNGEAQNGWVMNGRANIILDNVIASRQAVPMIVVMPQGHALQGANVGPLVRLSGETSMFSPRFPTDLLEDVIPLVERTYHVRADASHRAIAGLSMGGGQALTIGLSNLDRFKYVLGYSAAVGGQYADTSDLLKTVLSRPVQVNQALELLWVSCGRQDFLFQNNKQFADALTAGGIKVTYHETEGAHVWSVWRRNLFETAQLLFSDDRRR